MDQNPISFEKISLPEVHQEELEAVGKRVIEKQIDYSANGIEKSRRDIFKDVLGERAEERGHDLEAVKAAPLMDTKRDLTEKNRQLQELVNLAATKGPIEASIEARKMADPWIDDQFHDLLISLHDELVRRKKLPEE